MSPCFDSVFSFARSRTRAALPAQPVNFLDDHVLETDADLGKAPAAACYDRPWRTSDDENRFVDFFFFCALGAGVYVLEDRIFAAHPAASVKANGILFGV